MFVKTDNHGYHAPLEGIEQKTLAYGEKSLMAEFRLKKGSVLPRHRHPHEQIGYLVSGRIRLHIADQVHECAPGDSWCIPGDAEHGADIMEDSIAVEVFSPVREEYLPDRR